MNATEMPTLPTLLTPIEAMRSLRVSYSTLRKMVQTGELRAVRIGPGRSMRIPMTELERIAAPLDVSAPSPGVLLSARDGGAPTK
jgi:excisionase family DNA binding protein